MQTANSKSFPLHSCFVPDYEYFSQMLARLKAMASRYKVRDCHGFLEKARLIMNRTQLAKSHARWTPFVVNTQGIGRSFDASPLDAFLPAPEMPAFTSPVESVA